MTLVRVIPNRSDAELMTLAQRDPRGPAFAQLYRRHGQEVLRYLVALLRDRDAAEDALQETFLRVFRLRASYDPSRAFRPWLYRVARNTALSALERAGRLTHASELEVPEGREGPLSALARQERIELTREALERVAPETRALLLQRHALGMKLAELAESWDCTERTIRNRLHAACGELAAALGRGRTA